MDHTFYLMFDNWMSSNSFVSILGNVEFHLLQSLNDRSLSWVYIFFSVAHLLKMLWEFCINNLAVQTSQFDLFYRDKVTLRKNYFSSHYSSTHCYLMKRISKNDEKTFQHFTEWLFSWLCIQELIDYRLGYLNLTIQLFLSISS